MVREGFRCRQYGNKIPGVPVFMAEFTKRLQVLFTEEEYNFLKNLSKEKRRSVGDLIRDAVSRIYRPSVPLANKRALETIREREYLCFDNLKEIESLLNE